MHVNYPNMNKETPRYTTILHTVRKNLKLSCNDYCIADMIYHLSANPDNKFNGWCYASKDTLGKCIGVSKQTVHKTINKLLKKGLITKHPENKYLKTTQFWYKVVTLGKDEIKSKQSLPKVNYDTRKVEINLPNRRPESLHNNHNDKDKSINNNLTPWRKKIEQPNKLDSVPNSI